VGLARRTFVAVVRATEMIADYICAGSRSSISEAHLSNRSDRRTAPDAAAAAAVVVVVVVVVVAADPPVQGSNPVRHCNNRGSCRRAMPPAVPAVAASGK